MNDQTIYKTRPAWLPEHLYPFESRTMDIDGNRVHYIDEGSGPTMLLLHGNPDWSFLYRDIVKDLRRDFRCVALDFPGFGLSEAKKGYGFTPGEHAAVLEAFIQALNLSDITLMVQDWGGPIGLSVAERMAGRFQALIIGATLAWPDFKRTQPLWLKLMMGFIISPLGKHLVRKNNMVVNSVLDYNMTIGHRPPTEAVKEAYRGPFPSPDSRLPTWIFPVHLFGNAGQTFLTEVEQGLSCLSHLPVLFVWGDADFSTSPERELARFKQHFPNHHTVLIEGAGHFFQESNPDETIAAIRTWWTTQKPKFSDSKNGELL